MKNKSIKKPHSQAIDAFIKKAKTAKLPIPQDKQRGRLIFALDATASREHSWQQACEIQGDMFDSTTKIGGLDIQLCYYRGFNEFEYSHWCNNSDELHTIMHQVYCVGGHTQIIRVLRHAYVQSQQKPVNALIFVGDSVEENVDTLCQHAGELALYGVPVFIFQEGNNKHAQSAFQEITALTHGAYAEFDASSAQQLSELLSAVAVYAAGGRQALQIYHEKIGRTVLALPSKPTTFRS
ncbi:MAG: VWA domain-containing protein [Thiohalomonadales bacterium]